MPTLNVNGVRLFYELSDSGDIPLVMVHGATSSHATWNPLRSQLPEYFRVLAYDRRGHSASERPKGQRRAQRHVEDLAALIESLDLDPAWLLGNSSGALISIRLAGEHPDLLRGVMGHEPPLSWLLANDPSLAPLLEEERRVQKAVTERIASGDHAGGIRGFIETGLGPGSWDMIPNEKRKVLIGNAPELQHELLVADELAFDLEWIKKASKPTLLTLGDQSPTIYAPGVHKLVEAIPRAEVVTLQGAGHIPHATHPDAYAETIAAFVDRHST